ncbi:hypothetical protein AXF42_Ash000895 [Apostasia shenzhenica]|uniref:PWWP domain-containing protein n=1 Tax=Apostasia shenzhenica TaxID=1088818 RepID=A0A2I0ATC9_9ASPA|nr:hypothetical protein AXF42_Ash000895 [Apostasia shenzhenica]
MLNKPPCPPIFHNPFPFGSSSFPARPNSSSPRSHNSMSEFRLCELATADQTGSGGRAPSDEVPSLDVFCCKVISSSPTRNTVDLGSDESVSGHSQHLGLCSFQSVSWKRFKSRSIRKPLSGPASLAKYKSLNSWINRKVLLHSNSYLDNQFPREPLLCSLDKSTIPSRDLDAWLAPGNIVWVKTITGGWWPAEVVDIIAPEGIVRRHVRQVVVQLFGCHELTWVRKAEDLSQFSDCYEERCKNHSEAFQDALKQALCKYGHEMVGTSQNGFIDACDSSVSSSTKHGHDEEGGRGRRRRKLKIHFDEISVPDKPARKLRRLKIMRMLGLVAPVGSPFSLSHRSS